MITLADVIKLLAEGLSIEYLADKDQEQLEDLLKDGAIFTNYLTILRHEESYHYLSTLASETFTNFFMPRMTADDFLELIKEDNIGIKRLLEKVPYLAKFIKIAHASDIVKLVNGNYNLLQKVFAVQQNKLALVALLKKINPIQLIEFALAERRSGANFLVIDTELPQDDPASFHPLILKIYQFPQEVRKLIINNISLDIDTQKIKKLTIEEAELLIDKKIDQIKLFYKIYNLACQFNLTSEDSLKFSTYDIKTFSIGIQGMLTSTEHRLFRKSDNSQSQAFINSFTQYIEEYSHKYNIIEIIEPVIMFMKDKKKLYFQPMERLAPGLEVITYIIFPSLIDQGRANLCGIASMLSLLVNRQPNRFCELALTLAEHGYINLKTKCYAKTKDITYYYHSIINVLLYTLKNAYNKLGYSAYGSAFFERFRGQTSPRQLAELLNDCGFIDIAEYTELIRANGKSATLECYVLNLYAKDHCNYENGASRLNKLREYGSEHCFNIILITPELTNTIFAGYANLGPDDYLSYKVLTLATLHWVYLTELTIDETKNQVELTIQTAGLSLTSTMPLEKFLAGFCGGISGRIPGLKLISSHEIKEEPEVTQTYLTNITSLTK